MSSKKSILVTGSHRSGSTWVGKMLNLSDQVEYIHEPCNKNLSSKRFDYEIEKEFIYATGLEKKKQEDFLKSFHEMLDFRFLPELAENYNWHYALRTKLKHAYVNYSMRKANKIPLVKDPLALLSADFLYENFGMRNICMIRGPLAFCSSLVKWQWKFPFQDLLDQEELIKRHFKDQEGLIQQFAEEEKPILNQAVLLWNLLYSVVRTYQKEYPEWIFVRHEDLVKDPINGFNSIYDFCEIAFTKQIKQEIVNSVSSKEKEATTASFGSRNADEVTKTWKKRLKEDEIAFVLNETEELRNHFYPSEKINNIS